MLTCEDDRRIAGVEVAAQPVVEPVPLTAAPAQAQDATVAVRVPQDGSVEEDVPGVATNRLLPRGRNQFLVFPQGLEDHGVETDVTSFREPLLLFFAIDGRFAVLEHVHEFDLRQVEFGDREGALVFRIDLPAVAQVLLDVEALGTINKNLLDFADHDAGAVPEKLQKFLPRSNRVLKDLVQGTLRNFRILTEVHHQGRNSLQYLIHVIFLFACLVQTVWTWLAYSGCLSPQFSRYLQKTSTKLW